MLNYVNVKVDTMFGVFRGYDWCGRNLDRTQIVPHRLATA